MHSVGGEEKGKKEAGKGIKEEVHSMYTRCRCKRERESEGKRKRGR